MIEIRGHVQQGLNNASQNFQAGDVEREVANLLGVTKVCHGTLNIGVPIKYAELDDGIYDLELFANQYNGKECVKIKRCKVNGVRCAIVRPDDHFTFRKFNCRIEVMSSVKLRDQLDLVDGAEVIVQFQGDSKWWKIDTDAGAA